MIQEERAITQFVLTTIHRVIQEERVISIFVNTYSQIQGDSRGKGNIAICT